MNVNLLRKNLGSPEFDQKLSHRIERLQAAELSPVERIGFLTDCLQDPVTFVTLCGVVYEPRLPESPDLPFFPFPYQVEVLYRLREAEERGEDLYIEKTRDMGITWTCIWYILWRWLSKDQFYCLIGSRKEEEVDNATPQSLFGKLRYGLYSLPTWMRPEKFRRSEHDLHMKLINPQRMSYVDGESANPNFARGKRASMILMDELLFWKFVRESWRSATDSSPCRIAVSTAKPSAFGRVLRDSFETQGKLITLDWHKHPFKDQAWYQAEVQRREADPLSVEGELEIRYVADPSRAYYPEVQNCVVEDREYDPNLPLYIGLDFGAQDKTAIVYAQRSTTSWTVIDAMEKNRKKLSWYYPFLRQGVDFTTKESYEFVNKFSKETFVLKKSDYLKDELERIKRFNSWKAPVMYCGEAAHRQAMIQSNTSIAQELAGIGVMLRINDLAIQHRVRRTATKQLLMRTAFSTRYGALDLFDALVNAVFPVSRDNSTSDEAKDKPVHDETADLRSALENLAVNVVSSGSGVREIIYRRS